MHFRTLALGLGLLLAAVQVSPARAQQLKSAPLDLQVFRPAMDSKGFLTLNASQILAPGDFSFGLVTTWGYRPLELTGAAGSNFNVNHLVTPSFQGAVGLWQQRQIGIELGVMLPIGIMAGKASPDDDRGTANTNDDIHYVFDGQGIGDITLHPKLRLSNASRNKVGLSLIPSIVLPTGNKE